MVRELVTQSRNASGETGIFKKLKIKTTLTKIHNMPTA
jgi:hypothetical protein